MSEGRVQVPIYCISDLHLGDGGARDNFQELQDREQRQDKLFAFLDFIDQERKGDGAELFLLGDIFEHWQCLPGAILTKHKKLIDRFAELDTKYIVGNHDIDFWGMQGTDWFLHPFFQGMTNRIMRSAQGGKRILFKHGHDADQYNKSQNPGIGRILTILAGMLEDEVRSSRLPDGTVIEVDLTDNVQEILSKLKTPKSPFAKTVGDILLFVGAFIHVWNATGLFAQILEMNKRYGTDVLELLKGATPAQNGDLKVGVIRRLKEQTEAGDADLIVVGHTHEPGTIPNEPWYHNCGCWVKETMDVACIRADGTAIDMTWDGQHLTHANRSIPMQL